MRSWPQVASRGLAAAAVDFEHIKVEKKDGIAVVTLHRPKALNALCDALMDEISRAIQDLDKDNDVGAIVLTGSEKAFAAGADIKEMANRTYMECYRNNMFAQWGDIAKAAKPTIAAVNGFALGGGCEVAMMCDMIIAGENAKFGQPEIVLGTIPGGGGTQRLVRAVGKSKAMEMILTGDTYSATDMERAGLVSRVTPKDKTLDEAVEVAKKIAGFSKPAVAMCKEAVNAAYEMTLQEGLHFERRLFHSTFATNDQKEGMAAFLEKRKPEFKDE